MILESLIKSPPKSFLYIISNILWHCLNCISFSIDSLSLGTLKLCFFNYTITVGNWVIEHVHICLQTYMRSATSPILTSGSIYPQSLHTWLHTSAKRREVNSKLPQNVVFFHQSVIKTPPYWKQFQRHIFIIHLLYL